MDLNAAPGAPPKKPKFNILNVFGILGFCIPLVVIVFALDAGLAGRTPWFFVSLTVFGALAAGCAVLYIFFQKDETKAGQALEEIGKGGAMYFLGAFVKQIFNFLSWFTLRKKDREELDRVSRILDDELTRAAAGDVEKKEGGK